MSTRRPKLDLYPGDLRRDVALQSCSIGARGTWYELLWVMHDGEPYGHLAVEGRPLGDEEAARLIGVPIREYRKYAAELLAAGVPGVREDGCWFNRRMVRDEEARVKRAAGGSLGGNPRLGVSYNRPGSLYLFRRADGAVKVGISVSPLKRLSKVRAAMGAGVTMVAHCAVDDMGTTESAVHGLLDLHREAPGSEWFRLPGEVEKTLVHHIESGTIHLMVTNATEVGDVSRAPARAQPPPRSEDEKSSPPEGVQGVVLSPAVEAAIGPYVKPHRFPARVRAAVAELLSPDARPSFPEALVIRALQQMQEKGRDFSGPTLVRWCANLARDEAANGAVNGNKIAKVRRG